jgi:uncharacterized protein (TIGR02246 family)
MLTRVLTAVVLGAAIVAEPLRAQDGRPAPDDHAGVEAIRTLLRKQVAAWNRGDLEAFMAPYWRSQNLVFTSGAEVRRGWQATYERYRKRYGSDVDTMGQLVFKDIEVTMLGSDAAWVLGRWHLTRRGVPSGGVFTLVLQRLDGDWRIVHDHTSARE